MDDAAATPDLGDRAPAPSKLERGTCVGRYVILDQLGAGGMGAVYRAFDPELNRPVALKLLHANEGESIGRHRERLVREAQALAQLSHPNVISVYDVGALAGSVFIAMELVEGQTLRRWLRESPRRPREILDAFLAAGEGLAAAHRAGLVHRDFKPENVMVGNDGRVRVLDFGLVRAAGFDSASGYQGPPLAPGQGAPPQTADPGPTTAVTRPSSGTRAAPAGGEIDAGRVVAAAESTPAHPSSEMSDSGRRFLLSVDLTVDGTVLGTPRYMAPEQHLGEEADARADQFSFCVSLYESLAGSPPFANREAVLDGQVASLPKDARLPARLRTLLLRGLAVDPAARWPTLDALLAELRKDPAATWRRAALLIVAALVVVVSATAGGLALRGWRRATQQAQLAHEFGQETAQVAAIARTAALLPLHDLEPEMAEIRARMSAIEEHMRAAGAVAAGPGHCALGQGYIALERWEDALRELEAAYATGYRRPELAHALGLAHGKLYQKALAALGKTDDPAFDLRRRQTIERAHRDPALRYLKEAGGQTAGVSAPEVVQGLIALYEHRYDDALALGRKATERAPLFFEAHTLDGDIQLARAVEQYEKGDVESALAALGEAGESYRAALQIARSSTEALSGECQRLIQTSTIEHAQGKSPEASVKAALAACERAHLARPSDAGLIAAQARAWVVLEDYQAEHSSDSTHAFEEAVRLGELALRLDSRDPEALRSLTDANETLGGEYELDKGADPELALNRAIDYGKRAIAADPMRFDPYLTVASAFERKGQNEDGQGKDPRPSLESSIEYAEKALRQAPGSFRAWNTLANGYNELGFWQSTHGIDPIAALTKAIDAYGKVVVLSPSLDLGFTNLGAAYNSLGEHLLRIGQDPVPALDKAITSAKKAIELTADEFNGHESLACSYSDVARWQIGRGIDPTPTLELAREELERTIHINDEVPWHWGLGDVEVMAARWEIARSRDPTPKFAVAEKEGRRALAQSKDKDAQSLRLLAEIARWRAEWLAQQKRSVDAVVRDGLALAARAAALKPDLAEAFAIEGALHVIAARTARKPAERAQAATRARAALDRALAINKFLAHEYRPLLDEAVRLASLAQ